MFFQGILSMESLVTNIATQHFETFKFMISQLFAGFKGGFTYYAF